jgi:hypothetical protein
VEKKATRGMIVLSGEREMLYGIVGLSKSKKETDVDMEETDPLQTPLATNNDSRGPPLSAEVMVGSHRSAMSNGTWIIDSPSLT